MMPCVEKLFDVGSPMSEATFLGAPLSLEEGSGEYIQKSPTFQ
jgi:hypothetical protein